jgi:hypothetical protein
VYRLAYNGDVATGQLAVFQGASEAPIPHHFCLFLAWLFRSRRKNGAGRVERATRKNSQLAAAQRVALENGSAAALLVGYVPHHFHTPCIWLSSRQHKMVRDAPSNRQCPARTALPTAHFERNDIIIICETVH